MIKRLIAPCLCLCITAASVLWLASSPSALASRSAPDRVLAVQDQEEKPDPAQEQQ